MQKSKPDKAKLQKLMFFSKSHIENLENEINTVIHLYRDGRLSFQNSMNSLHNGKDDIMNIFWHITTKINEAQKSISTISNYHSLKAKGFNIKAPVFPELPEDPRPSFVKSKNPIINELMEAFQSFQDGEIDFQKWESVALKCKAQLKSENICLQVEVRDILRKSKKYFQNKRKQMIREHKAEKNDLIPDQVSDEDMEVKKIK